MARPPAAIRAKREWWRSDAFADPFVHCDLMHVPMGCDFVIGIKKVRFDFRPARAAGTVFGAASLIVISGLLRLVRAFSTYAEAPAVEEFRR